jgi:hypothetical protein
MNGLRKLGKVRKHKLVDFWLDLFFCSYQGTTVLDFILCTVDLLGA